MISDPSPFSWNALTPSGESSFTLMSDECMLEKMIISSLDLENATLLSEGSFESDPGGYILYGEDDDTEYGFIAFIQQDIFDLTFYDTNETKEFFLLIN